MTDEELRSLANIAGLKKMLDEHSLQLKTALSGAKALADRLPRDLAPEVEPAHVYRLAPSTKRSG